MAMGDLTIKKRLELTASAAMVPLVVFLLAAMPAGAATFSPTRFDDPVPDGCRAHDCSLREAIDAANAQADRDTVQLQKGTYEIQLLHVPGSAANETGDLAVGYPATIKGKGPTETKVDANGLDRVFYIGGITSEVPVKFQALAMKGGDPTAVPFDSQHPGVGGGIYAYTGAVTLKHVAIQRNEASLGGGARLQVTNLKIIDSTISRNAAAEGGGLILLSAIFNTPVATIRSSTISNNSAVKGGGILADGYHPNPSLYPPDVVIRNSTIAGNHTSAEGGGIMADNDATVTLDNSTVAYNTADDDSTGGSYGGGVHQHSGAVFTLGDSIVASNTVGTGSTDPACSGTFAGDGNDLTAAAGCDSLSPGTNQFVGSALIGPLGSNGGPTKTAPLLASSPAIGYAVTCPTRDQRGETRPPNCDSGAYERKGP
jgi:hypothetical protein